MVKRVTALVLAAVVWTGCAHQPQVRPASIVIACGDANFYVDHLRWKSWGAGGATATGTAHRNDCKPNCAAGHFHASPVTVRLSRVVTCVKGRHEFARISWGARANSETLSCSFLKLKP
jgi:hypothetical protein